MSEKKPAHGFIRAGDLGVTDLAPGELRAVMLSTGERVCVGNHAGDLFAVRDVCTHSEFPLSEGALYANGELECCFHGAKFDCRSGAVLRGPAEDPVATYEVRVIEGEVWLRPATAGPKRDNGNGGDAASSHRSVGIAVDGTRAHS